MFRIFWNDNEIGTLSRASNDMWYLEGEATFNNTSESKAFEKKMETYDAKSSMQQPETTLRLILTSVEDPNRKLYCPALSLDGNKLFFGCWFPQRQ